MDSEAIRKLLDEATPGPWVIGPGKVFEEGPGLEKLPASIDAKDGTEVLYGCGCCGSPNMNWANARLIAAAPDLAAEVLRLREQIERLHRDIESGAFDPKC